MSDAYNGDHGQWERLRDQFFALSARSHDESAESAKAEKARARFRATVDALDVPSTASVQGLALSYFPTARFKQVRFLDASVLDESVRDRFARPCAKLPHLAAAFVDPEEFSYRTFENIICLDRWFESITAADVSMSRRRRSHRLAYNRAVRVSPELAALLAELDELGVYSQPLNASSRGGKRFIFHAAALAAALTEALREALPKKVLKRFVHVNPVFRCNRFDPGDARFLAHVDSPYHDPARKHVSRYTLLLYLTGGKGDGILAFADGERTDKMLPMTAVVFPQSLRHEGGPYRDGRKVFLRTELIFEEPTLRCDPGISQLFAKACYLSGESVFAPELARHTHDAYDRAAAAHWHGLQRQRKTQRFVHKRFRGVEFIANGYDFWFARGRLPLPECAAITILDVLNAKIGASAFRKLCTTKVIARRGRDSAWIGERLNAYRPDARPDTGRPGDPARTAEEPPFAALAQDALFPEPEFPEDSMSFPTSPDFEADPFPGDWDATRHPEVVDMFKRSQDYARRCLRTAPISIMGQELYLQPEHFVVRGNRIYVLAAESLEPVHFAGAVFYHAEDFVGVDVDITTLQLLVPPIFFRETGDTLHLMFDLFRNGWMVDPRPWAAPVPRIIDDPEASPEGSPWLYAAGRTSDRETVWAQLGLLGEPR